MVPRNFFGFLPWQAKKVTFESVCLFGRLKIIFDKAVDMRINGLANLWGGSNSSAEEASENHVVCFEFSCIRIVRVSLLVNKQ